MLVESFPALPTFDSFISFPQGAHIPWPVGFDLLVALPGLLGLPYPSLGGWGALLMPLLGGLSVYLTYRLVRAIFDPASGLVASVFMAFMGGVIGYTMLGRVDHHGLVAPVTIGMFLAMLASIRAGTPRKTLAWGGLCGLLTAFSVGSWIITPPLYFLPVPMTILAVLWSGGAENARRAAWSCLVSAAVLVLAAVLTMADVQAKPFSLYQPSWFTVILFALVPIFVLPFFYRRMAPAGIAAVGLLLAAAVVFLPEFYSPLRQAFEIAGGADFTYLMADESQNLFFRDETFLLRDAVAGYTYLLLLVPFMLVAYLYRTIRARDFSAASWLGLSFSFLAIVLLMLQRRFGEFAAPALSLLFGWSITSGARFFVGFFRNAPSRARAVVWAVLLVIGLGAAISPLAVQLIQSVGRDPVRYNRELLVFGRELKKHTPPPEGPGGELAYGMICGWSEAHPLLYETKRPVMVSSFGTPEAKESNRRAFDLVLSADEETAYRGMTDSRIRYVVTSNYLPSIYAMARIAGRTERFITSETVDTGEGYKFNILPLRPLAESVFMRMFLCDGSGLVKLGYAHKPLSHYRLLLESSFNTFLGEMIFPMFKAFEVVPGARLAGVAESGERIRLKLPLVTNTGRRFMYRSETTAGPDGRFEFVVPYPTESIDSGVSPLGPYLVKVGDEIFEASVTEEDLRAGQVVNLCSRGP